jgi:hypothetical protein
LKKRTSKDFVKSLPKITGNEKASPLLKKTIAVVNGKAGGETALIEDRQKKLKPSNHVVTVNEKFWNWFESRPWGMWVAYTFATALIVAVAYWGIKQ